MPDVTDYTLLSRQLAALAEDSSLWLPLLADASALIFESLPDVSWAGFYLAMDQDLLVLGPFQGKLACTKIPIGKGVCGTAAAEDRTQVVPDVHLFPGHIACDAASASEIVVPIHAEGADGSTIVAAVLDIDSVTPGRFAAQDAEGLGHFCRTLEQAISWKLPPLSADRSFQPSA